MKDTIETTPPTLDRTTNNKAATPAPHHDEAWDVPPRSTPRVMSEVDLVRTRLV